MYEQIKKATIHVNQVYRDCVMTMLITMTTILKEEDYNQHYFYFKTETLKEDFKLSDTDINNVVFECMRLTVKLHDSFINLFKRIDFKINKENKLYLICDINTDIFLELFL